MTPAQYEQKLQQVRNWRKNNPDYHKNWIKKNKNKRKLQSARASRKWHDKPENLEKKAEKTRLKTHGVTRDWFANKLIEQGNCCAICKTAFTSKKDAVIDHDHLTGEIRDLLCHRCNTGIGFLREDEAILLNSIEYLRFHKRKQSNPLAPTDGEP